MTQQVPPARDQKGGGKRANLAIPEKLALIGFLVSYLGGKVVADC